MILRMTIIGDVKPPDPQDVSHSFGSQGGKIGRGLSNEWVLPDPHMSKNHCSIQFRDGQFSITDTSTNGVFLNGAVDRMERGSTAVIKDGDRLKIGDYEIRLEIDEAAEAAPMAELDSFAKVLGVGMSEDPDPFAINSDNADRSPPEAPPVSPGTGSSDPFDDILDAPAARSGDEDPLFAGLGAGSSGSGGSVIPEDDDLFGDLMPKSPSSPSANPLDTVEAEQDHVPSPNEFFQPPKVVGEQIPDDWDTDDLLSPSPEEPAFAAPQPQAPPAPPAPIEPPSSAAPAAPVTPVAPTPPTPPTPTPPKAPMPAAVSDAEAALLHAFLEGAELTDLEVPEAARIEMMRTVGQTYRDLVRGLVEVLKVRQSIKNEFRLDQTMIRAEDNNPLKFTVNVEDALKAMLGNTSRGYLTPRRAVDQGFADIKAHQIAVMAGMQVALKALLLRFDPKELEDRLQEGSVFDKVLPGSKKARHWELFTQLYAEIAKEAEDDFHGLFGREFARAYEEQAKKV